MNDLLDRALSLEPLIRTHADQAERDRRLAKPVADAFSAANLYRLAAPRVFGGLEADPITQIEVIEAVSRADGSAGWNLMIGVETLGLITPGFSKCADLIEDPFTVMSSSTAAVGRADRVEGGYRVSGRWQFVSGVHNSQLFGATVALYENGERMPGPPRVYAIITQGDYHILDTWHVGGMRGSGSHDVEVNDVFVPDNHVVSHFGGVQYDTPLHRFPLGPRLSYNKVAVALGIARHALDVFYEIATEKKPRFSSSKLRERPFVQHAIAKAEVRLRASRALVFELTETLWRHVQDDTDIPDATRALFHIACSDAAQACAESVDRVCEAAGTTANQLESPLERIARDVRVVRQHLTVAPQHIDDGGRMLLGLPPMEMMLKT